MSSTPFDHTSFPDLLERIAYINNILHKEGPADPLVQAKLVELLMDAELRGRLQDKTSGWGEGPHRVVIFHRRQQLYLLKSALTRCPLEGGQRWDESTRYLYGRASLMVNDVFDPGEMKEGPEEELAGAASLLPHAIFYMDMYQMPIVGRARWLWLKLQQEEALRSHPKFVDFEAAFTRQTGVSLRHYFAAMIGLLSQCLQFDPEAPDFMARLRIRRSTFLSNCAMNQEVFDKVLDNLSLSLRELRRRVQQDPTESDLWDFSLLQRYPLIEYEPDLLLCYDGGLLLKVFTEGIYWQIHDSLSGAERNNFRSYFGDLFTA